jgi:hypothetical protein
MELDDVARLGRGDDTSIRVSVRRDRPAALAGESRRLVAVVFGADRLHRPPERGIVAVDDDLGEQGGDRAAVECVAQRQLEQVADHPFALGVEHVQRVGRRLRVRGGLEGEQPDLRAVAVCEDEPVPGCELAQRDSGRLDPVALPVRLGRLAPAQQCIATERDEAARQGTGRHAGSVLDQSPVKSV